jgi:hypothetical protein
MELEMLTGVQGKEVICRPSWKFYHRAPAKKFENIPLARVQLSLQHRKL